MPFGLINIIPKITTERALIAFICLLVGWLLVEFLRQRLRSDEKLIRASLPKERFPALKALLTHFDVDSESLAPEQRLQLALEQVRFKHSRDRGRHILWGLLLFLAATVSIFAINRAFPDLNQYAGIESGQPPVPAASPNALIGSNDSGSRGSGDRTVKLPFIVRAINPATLEEEPTTDVQMTVADLSNPVPVDAPRSGELFVVSTKETERTTIHTSASTGSYKIERTVVISGYTVSQMPCGQRVFYLPIRSTNITTKALSVAVKSLQEQTKCESIDRALVIWESLHELVTASGPGAIPSEAKYPKELVEYNWARGNYQACISLGYEQQCEIAEAAFRSFDKGTLKKLAISERDKSMVLSDVKSVPLQISYTKMKKIFAFHDYLEAAKTAEILLASFEKNTTSWEHLNISKSRLYVDAAISWLHYADSLTSRTDTTERKRRCELYERALSYAKQAQWFDFRQRHVPLIEQKIANCVEGLRDSAPGGSRT